MSKMTDEEFNKLTPMMKQYYELKKKAGAAILFFRMGDFYELFFEDAKIASKILNIILSERNLDRRLYNV